MEPVRKEEIAAGFCREDVEVLFLGALRGNTP